MQPLGSAGKSSASLTGQGGSCEPYSRERQLDSEDAEEADNEADDVSWPDMDMLLDLL